MFRQGKLACDMEATCTGAVTHLDSDGYAYCEPHAARRRSGGHRMRKLRPAEIRRLEGGGTIKNRAGAHYALTDRSGRVVARAHNKASAHRAARRTGRVGSSVNRAGKVTPPGAANRVRAGADSSTEWQPAARRYLERLGMAEWEGQGRPVPKPSKSGVPHAKKGRYSPSEYHRSLIERLNANDEEGFKAIKLREGYASTLGV